MARNPSGLLRYSTSNSSSSSNPSTTHFGFKTVPEESKEEMVGQVFANVAEKYDVMNDFMSAGIHRIWKDHLIRTIAPFPTSTHLDVAGGTGDIAFRVLDYIKNVHGDYSKANVTVLDINPAMLAVGKQRAKDLGYLAANDPDHNTSLPSTPPSANLTFIEGNAESLSQIPSNSIDTYTIAFGIRNVTHIDKALQEAFRVLKRGGRFTCLEFSRVNNDVLRSLYDQYSFNVIPAMGEAIANDRDSYQYLVESIRKFPPQRQFADMIRTAGFTTVGQEYEDLTFGIAAIHTGWKL